MINTTVGVKRNWTTVTWMMMSRRSLKIKTLLDSFTDGTEGLKRHRLMFSELYHHHLQWELKLHLSLFPKNCFHHHSWKSYRKICNPQYPQKVVKQFLPHRLKKLLISCHCWGMFEQLLILLWLLLIQTGHLVMRMTKLSQLKSFYRSLPPWKLVQLKKCQNEDQYLYRDITILPHPHLMQKADPTPIVYQVVGIILTAQCKDRMEVKIWSDLELSHQDLLRVLIAWGKESIAKTRQMVWHKQKLLEEVQVMKTYVKSSRSGPLLASRSSLKKKLSAWKKSINQQKLTRRKLWKFHMMEVKQQITLKHLAG